MVGPPVIGDFVIVPGGERWDFLAEFSIVLIQEIVAVIAAILFNGFRDLGFRRGYNVSPAAPVGC